MRQRRSLDSIGLSCVLETTVEVPILTAKAVLRGDVVANDQEDHASSQSRRRRALSERLAYLDCNTGGTIRDNSHVNQLIIRILSFKAILVHGKGKVKEMLAGLNRGCGIWKAWFWLLVKKVFQNGRFPHLRSLAGWR